MIRVTCPGCGSTFEAKDSLAGQQRKCPKCSQPITIPGAAAEAPTPQADQSPAAEASPAPAVQVDLGEGIHKVEAPTRLARLNRYLICDRASVYATWADNGSGWQLKTNAGQVSAKRNPDLLLSEGSFTLVELVMARGDEGLSLKGIRCYKLFTRYALAALEQDEHKILGKIAGPGCLNRDQKTVVLREMRAQFMPEVWENAAEAREFLSNADYVSPGTG